jgi:hypothetical protein
LRATATGFGLQPLGEGPVREWARIVAIAMLAAALVLVFAVDTDGNPLTQDYPNVVVRAAVAGDLALECEDAADDGEGRDCKSARRVARLHRAPHRWLSAVRRWHRSFLTDAPV